MCFLIMLTGLLPVSVPVCSAGTETDLLRASFSGRCLAASAAGMFCWGSTVSGELGLGAIEEQQVRSARHLATLPAGTQIVQGR